MDHYKYLEIIIEDFWKEIFNKTLEETWNSGIICSHGDKGYGYKRKWDNKGINFNRGMLIFLLTYTDIMDRPKYESCKFVIDKYVSFKPIIEKIERKHFHELTFLSLDSRTWRNVLQNRKLSKYSDFCENNI